MARKIDQPDPQSDDLVILHPEQTLSIAGRPVTVREYGFVEGLKLRPLMKPILEPLYQVMKNGQSIELETVLDILASHTEAVIRLIATSIDEGPGWVEQLNDSDGELLLMTWWGVNGPFFVRKLRDRLLSNRMQQLAENKIHNGATSTQSSLPTDTTLDVSETTPNGS